MITFNYEKLGEHLNDYEDEDFYNLTDIEQNRLIQILESEITDEQAFLNAETIDRIINARVQQYI